MFNINLMLNIFHYHSTLKVKSIIITLIFFLFFFIKLETFKKYFLEKKFFDVADVNNTSNIFNINLVQIYSTLIWFKHMQH